MTIEAGYPCGCVADPALWHKNEYIGGNVSQYLLLFPILGPYLGCLSTLDLVHGLLSGILDHIQNGRFSRPRLSRGKFSRTGVSAKMAS